MRVRLPAVAESVEELQDLLKANRKAHLHRRIHLLLLIRSGQVETRKQAAKHLAIHRNTIRNWLRAYQSDGLQGLLHFQQAAPPAEQKTLPEPVYQDLQNRLDEGGFAGGYLEARCWLRDEFGMEVSYKTLHRILYYRLKAKLKRARPSHAKKNEAEVAAFPSRLRRLIDAVAAFSQRALRLFVQDESRFGLHEGMMRRCLTAFGVKPIQTVLPRYEYFWLYGAVEPATGEGIFLERPALDTACFQAYIDEFSRTYPDTLNLLIIDGAPAHTAKSLRIPENVLLVRLPPYSPELNPIERLWQDMRKWLGSELPASLDALKERIAQIIRDYSRDTLASITGYDYLLQALGNAQSV